MRLTYPLLWSRLGRQADREQTVSTVAALARRGVEMTLLMPQGRDDPALTAADLRSYYGVEGDFALVQRRIGWVGGMIVPQTLWLRRVLRDPTLRASDLLYSRIPVSLGIGRFSLMPFVFEHYRPWPDRVRWLRPIFRRTARQPHCLGFILHSDYAAESFRRLGVAPEKILVAHNGFDPARMRPPMERNAARAALGLPPERTIALYSGRISPRKGLERLLEAAARRPEILFLLVGSEGEGPIEAAARGRENVRVLPWQTPDALPAYLFAADILVIPPSRAPLERFGDCVLPLKTFAYLAAGRAILAPDSPDTAELLRDGHTALLVPPDDPDAAADGFARLAADPALRARLGANAARLADGLSWDARAARIEAFLEERLDAVRRRGARGS
ncbi:MAG TPA: glycosyltransferase [Allosphingosinicella sp.]|jgi:glycosyltransferase involved in cell wall biosynthesis|nr:glycosyltransferase [Allosphingosinicella sp.]